MSEMVYEFATSVPEEALVELYKAGGWWREEPSARVRLPALVKGSFCFVVAREPGGRIVGMGRAISDGVSDAYIQDVAVLPEFRGRGVGREIVRRLTERCLATGLRWIGLVAQPGTQGFYRSLGYHAVDGHQLMLHGKKKS